MLQGSHEWRYDDEDRGLLVEGMADYTIIPGCRGIRTLPNGDPGFPDDPPEVELYHIRTTKVVLCGYELPMMTRPSEEWVRENSPFFDKIEDALIDHIIEEHSEPEHDC